VARLRDARFSSGTTTAGRPSRTPAAPRHGALPQAPRELPGQGAEARALAGWVASDVLGRPTRRRSRAGRAGWRKTDLPTDMVRELTELQGTMGGIYARVQGQPEEVWRAIYHHYLPLGIEPSPRRRAPDWARPRSRGRRLNRPTSSTRSWPVRSSERPTGTRRIRSASGARPRGSCGRIVDLPELTGFERPSRLAVCWSGPAGRRRGAWGEGRADAWRDAVTAFLLDRLRYLFEQRGFVYDELNAVLAHAAACRTARRRDGSRRCVMSGPRPEFEAMPWPSAGSRPVPRAPGAGVEARRPLTEPASGSCWRSSSAGRDSRSERPWPARRYDQRVRIAVGFGRRRSVFTMCS